jgi:hypothetical protein
MIHGQNLSLAYMHFYSAKVAFKFDTSEVLRKLESIMTEQEKLSAKKLINNYNKGECVYDNRI